MKAGERKKTVGNRAEKLGGVAKATSWRKEISYESESQHQAIKLWRISVAGWQSSSHISVHA